LTTTPDTSGGAIENRPRQPIGTGFHSSIDHTQCRGLHENRTGSDWPTYGGGPVLAKACTAFAATTTNSSQPVIRSIGRSSRTTRLGSPSFNPVTSAPTSTSVTQKMKNDHV
jgi:hypothetical protein